MAGRIDVRRVDGRPRLTLVARDGDPAPALVVAVAIDAGPIASAALSALVEGRLRAAGFEVDARADRASFRVRWGSADPARAGAFLEALVTAFAAPIASGAPELSLVARRVRGLKEAPIDAAELAGIATCTGEIGAAAAEVDREVDAAGMPRSLEAWRRESLHTGRASIAAVGPAAFGAAVASAAERTTGWPSGSPPEDAWPSSDPVTAYASSTIARRSARVSVAVRIADPAAAVAAAEQLARPDSALSLRLGGLPQPWQTTAVTGTARPRGGCVAVTIETTRHPGAIPVESSAAIAGAIVAREITAELAAAGPSAVAARQILTAADAREAAGRAAWWALSGAVPGAPPRTAIAVGLSATDRAGADLAPVRAKIEADLGRARAPAVLERRVAVERGQGELWILLASPCGSSEEGTQDAATSGLAVLTAIASRRPSDVAIEPWITPDGVGVIAHGAPIDEHEAADALARRVADEAARTLTASALTAEGLASARSQALRQVERGGGLQGAALDAFLGAASPDHPSWLEPLGPWSRAANASLDAVRLRRHAIAAGPIRVAVIAPAGASEAAVAADAVGRWLAPAVATTTCRPAPTGLPRAGRYDAKLPSDTPIAQALVGVGVPPTGATGHDLAELTALALDGDGGALATALAAIPGARATARLLGGARTAALVVDVRAPADSLDAAVTEVKGALAKLAQRVTEASLSRAIDAAARTRRSALGDPRARLVELWRGVTPARPSPALAAWRDWLGSTLRDPSFIVVEARPE